ncbi:conserved hypothetical protein [Clostridium neonatale]|uniref:Phage tail assembly protein n=2 Tax=Clostridiaceae TaxID=31979 RepID=A0ABY6T072_9CLOT|nr:conserved hypothetical protein [Clostridium neonatale]VDG74192.1 Uncharacterised protein [Clostridium carnis]CAI3570553.1 conserved hypothetical protein [Clostridium neonatale]CAI3656551.1 conserved hypothetical protein [Clostridium neonatale]CAI3657538.1 conserved hypothetical protein [Clostridium neonatale]
MLMEENKKTEILETTSENEIIENELYVKFNRIYTFDGEEYSGIDLSGLEELTANDMIWAQKQFERKGGASVLIEMNMEYCLFIASRACKKPVEFFAGLKMNEAVRIKNKITGFLFSQD